MERKNYFSYKEDELAVFRRRKIGFIFQSFNLISSLNVWENIIFPISLDGKKIDEAFLKDIIQTLGLEKKLQICQIPYPAGSSRELPLQEPLHQSRKSFWLMSYGKFGLQDKVRRLWEMLKMSVEKYGQTLVMITHDEDIAQIADRILVIEDGKVAEFS